MNRRSFLTLIGAGPAALVSELPPLSLDVQWLEYRPMTATALSVLRGESVFLPATKRQAAIYREIYAAWAEQYVAHHEEVEL